MDCRSAVVTLAMHKRLTSTRALKLSECKPVGETAEHIYKGRRALPSKPWIAPAPVLNPNVKARPASIICTR